MIDLVVRCFAILSAMDKRPEPPPWGRLITEALRQSGLSARKAAGLAGLSEGRWRQITSGYQNVSEGVYAPVRGPAATVARMAQVVGVTPAELEDAGRADAAEELRRIARQAEPERPTGKTGEKLQLIREIRERLEALERLDGQRDAADASNPDEDTA